MGCVPSVCRRSGGYSGMAKGLVGDQALSVELMRHLSSSRFEEILTELWCGQPHSSAGQESAGAETSPAWRAASRSRLSQVTKSESASTTASAVARWIASAARRS
jgi:hypothetical protein